MQMGQDNVKTWDGFWEERDKGVLEPGLDEWTKLVWQVGLEFWQEVFERFSPGKKMLECGAGSAQVSAYMARQGYDCTMLDNSNEGLKAGTANFEKAGLKGTFVLGDVQKIEFEDNTFDIVYSGGLIEHFRDVKPPIKEMVRILRPGGLFAATIIPKRFSCQSLANVLIFLVKFFRRIIHFQFRGSIKESRRNFPFYENSIPLKEYRRILEESALENVVANGAGPFPALPLPKSLQSLYISLMRKLIPLWKRFDRSTSWFTEIWGDNYVVYGVKRRRLSP